MKIQDYITSGHKYKIDYTYQRPKGIWSTEDNACLIDTILRDEPIPLIFLNCNSEENVFYIIDGQQRLNAIKKFYDNKLKLNKKFSGQSRHGQTFSGSSQISDGDRERFLNYQLKTHIVEDYDDERVRLIFSRLQRGKPLQLGERLNAKAGNIVVLMRKIAQHPFMLKSIGVTKTRYGTYADAARVLFYEKHGTRLMGSNELFKFFDENKDMAENSKEFKKTVSILNFLVKCFPTEPGNYKHLEKHAWVLSVYTMVRDLSLLYSLQGKEKGISKFIFDFHSKVYNEMFRSSKTDYQRFYDNVRGGWSEKIILLRKKILINNFLKSTDLVELDDRRQISDEEKISVFAQRQSCEICGCDFKDYKEAEYHHIERYTDGGKTEIDNTSILCAKCHDELHGKGEIVLPSEDEKEESDI